MADSTSSKSTVHRNAELKPEESILILFHGGIPPKQVCTTVSEDLTCEKVLIMCIEHIQSFVCSQEAKPETHRPNKYLPTFGLLALPEEKIWLPLNYIFKKSSENHRKYKFRVRFRLPADKFIDGPGNVMTEYLFLQTREDFLKGSLGKHEKLSREKAFGLLHIALLFPPTVPMDSAEKVNEAFKSCGLNIWNYTRYFSKALARRFISVPGIDHFWVYKTVRAEIHKYKTHEPPARLGFYKQQFYQLLMKAVPEYCFDTYEATENDSGLVETVTANISLYEESGKQKALFYGDQIQCTLTSISSIKIIKPKDHNDKKWTVLMNLEDDGPPKILLFSEEGAAESFVSMIQGYFRLCICYNSVLCEELQTTSLKISTELKSFGPIGEATAATYFKVSAKTKESDCGAFLIHESLDKLGTYHVKVRPSSNPPDDNNTPDSGTIECLPDGRLKLKIGEQEITFDRCCQVRSHLTSRFGLQVVASLKTFSMLADINEEFQETKIEYYGPYTTSEDVQIESTGLLVLNKDLLRVSEIPDKNPLIKKYKVMFHDDQMMLLELQSNNDVFATAFREGLVKLQTLYRIKNTSFLKFYCMVLDPMFSVLMEFTPHHDVLTYICKNPQSVAQKVHIMDQIIKIIIVMEKHNIYHGNLRLRKCYAFGPPGSNQITVKLGDPGIVSRFDELNLENIHNVERAPWLSPERRKGLKKITYESEVYALGTTLYEILCQTDQFPEELKLSASENMLTYLKKNRHLPPPPVLLDNNKELSSEEDDGKKLVPEALEVLTMIWEMILMCWEEDPAYRPSISYLITKMEAAKDKVHTFDADTVLDQKKELAYDIGMTRKDLKTEDNKRLTVTEIEKRLQTYLNQRYLPKDCLDLNISDKPLGSGFYGAVFKGQIRRPEKRFQNTNGSSVFPTPVAVKRIKREKVSKLDRRMVYKEIKVAYELDHPNVVKLLYLTEGVYDARYDPLMMVMEFMDKGNLSEYAVGYGELSDPKNVCHMLSILLDVAEGMVYLSGKDIIHRDLAARNVLLTNTEGGGMRAKVSDFGLARILEGNSRFYRVNQDQLPFPWMPPESLVLDPSDPENTFSSKGDVWSFGILMWESFSEGALPKTVLQPLRITDGEQLLAKYKSNWRLPGDGIRSQEAYSLMKKCWQMEPSIRPAFVELVQKLKHLISKLQGNGVGGK